MEKTFTIARPDGLALFGRSWPATGAERYRVFVGHSHVVHSGMLGPLALGFTEAGCGVVAADIRGHGRSINRANPLGHLDGRTGWGDAVDDLIALLDHTFEGVPHERRLVVMPNVLALMTLCALQQRPDLAGQIVLVAPPPNQPLIARLGAAFASARAKFRDPASPDEQALHHIYSYLGSQLPERTHPLDVVTPDRTLIQRIIDDPLSWQVPTTAYWQAVFHGMHAAWTWPRRLRLHPETRFLILYGEADPMTRNGAFCGPMIEHLRHHGAREVTSRGIAGARTGLFLEEERLGLSGRILAWCDHQSPPTSEIAMPMARSADEFARERVSPDEHMATPLPPDEFLSLCYAGIQDETRWVEILTRMILAASSGPRDGLEAQILEMMPHWDRAFQLQQQLLTQAALGEVWADVLDRLGMACALVEVNGKVLHENRRCRQVLERIVAHDDAAADLARGTSSGLTQRLIRQSVSDGGRLSPSGTPLMWEGEPVGLFFRPAALDVHARQLGNPIGLLLLRDEAPESGRLALMEFAYGLTRQEAQVALGVMRGESPAEIADRLAVSINTVRTHLAQAYAKTGSSGKAEMAARLHASPVGWLASADNPTADQEPENALPIRH